jgi:hypothetical protein
MARRQDLHNLRQRAIHNLTARSTVEHCNPGVEQQGVPGFGCTRGRNCT